MTRRRDVDDASMRKVALVAIARVLGVSEACRRLDLSRDTYYRLARIYRNGGFQGLVAAVGPGHEGKPRTPREVEAAIIEASEREPQLGKIKVAARVRATGLSVSPATVGAVWKRHGMTRAAQRVQRLQHGAEHGSNLDGLVAEQRRLASEVARMAGLLSREPRKSPRRSQAPGVTPAATANRQPQLAELFETLFGARPTVTVESSEASPEVTASAVAPTETAGAMLVRLFSSNDSPEGGQGADP